MLASAFIIASRAHEGQQDKAGQPYIDHPVRVASMVEGEDAKVVALLHDVVEDSDVSLDDLAEVFPPHIVAAVAAVSRRDGESYFEFVARAALDPIGKVVKRADVQDHLGPGHEDAIPASLIKRYRKALVLLDQAPQVMRFIPKSAAQRQAVEWLDNGGSLHPPLPDAESWIVYQADGPGKVRLRDSTIDRLYASEWSRFAPGGDWQRGW